jgi:hypothetical protein
MYPVKDPFSATFLLTSIFSSFEHSARRQIPSEASAAPSIKLYAYSLKFAATGCGESLFKDGFLGHSFSNLEVKTPSS